MTACIRTRGGSNCRIQAGDKPKNTVYEKEVGEDEVKRIQRECKPR